MLSRNRDPPGHQERTVEMELLDQEVLRVNRVKLVQWVALETAVIEVQPVHPGLQAPQDNQDDQVPLETQVHPELTEFAVAQVCREQLDNW